MRLLFCIALAGLAACGQEPAVLIAPADEPHARLSQWGILGADRTQLELYGDTLPYELNTPLFSDYAGKLRTVTLPDGGLARMDAAGDLDFPVGTILSKTFYYAEDDRGASESARVAPAPALVLQQGRRLPLGENVLIETRLLVHYADGWRAFPYVWNAAQDEAWLEIAGDVKALELVAANGSSELTYIVPDANQCANCHTPNHTTKALAPLGPQGWQLNRLLTYDVGDRNQLAHWQARGMLEADSADSADSADWPDGVDWSDTTGTSIELRAKAYLDANCAHCHNPAGAADTSALNLELEAPVDRRYGVCKTPVAVGRGSGDRTYDIYPGRPEDSILVYRMEHTDPAIAMPELGRSLAHAEGVALMRDWIGAMNGEC